jgi:hypothetical protein
MKNEQGHVPPSEATEKDWEDFFEGWGIPEGTTYPVVENDEWLCVASQHGRIQVQQTSERLAAEARKQKSPPSGYVFDR